MNIHIRYAQTQMPEIVESGVKSDGIWATISHYRSVLTPGWPGTGFGNYFWRSTDIGEAGLI